MYLVPEPQPRLSRGGVILRALGKGLAGLFRRSAPSKVAESYRVLITGATTGVGLALARHLLAHTNHRLALTARPNSLKRFRACGIQECERVMLVPLDVEDERARETAIELVEEQWGGVDVLVNNAGLCYRAVVEHASPEEENAQLDVNYLAPMALTRLVLKGMRRRGFGRIVNVTPAPGMTALPTLGAYSASKFALAGASEALWYEVRPWGIGVTLVEPGFVHTEGLRGVGADDDERSLEMSPAYAGHYEGTSEIVSQLSDPSARTSAHVAARIAKVIAARNPPLRVAGTWDAFAFSMMRRLLPQRFVHALLYGMLPRVNEWGRALPPPAESVPPASGTLPCSSTRIQCAEPVARIASRADAR